MLNSDTDLAYGCLFCRTGREKIEAAELERHVQGIETMVPVKSRYWRHQGKAIEEQVILFPGYIFFRAHCNFKAHLLTKLDDIYTLLKSPSDSWQLWGDDLRLVKKLFAHQGVIGLSKVYFEGDRIRILDGYLKDYESQIVRVNRRARTAQIKLQIHENDVLVWLGFEEMDCADVQKAKIDCNISLLREDSAWKRTIG